jgi:hypothetical protein
MHGTEVIPAEAVEAADEAACEPHPHHWVSINVPGLTARWVIQCSLCGAYNVDEMNAALEAAALIILSHEADRARLERIESPWGNR